MGRLVPPGRGKRGQALRRRSGQAYLEFIVVLPGIMLLTLLAWEFAYFWWGRMVVATGTFEAARQVASGEPATVGYALYDDMLSRGMGRMAERHRGHFEIAVQPELRSVAAQASVPYQWPTGLGALMGGTLDLTLDASAFFRLEQAQFGPPEPGGFD
jgi:hypothetical protein